MTIMVVTPPAAAAADAEARVSRCSLPGSPVNTRMSISPGMSRRPRQSMTGVPAPAVAGDTARPAATIRPSAMSSPPGCVEAEGGIDQAGIDEGAAGWHRR